MHYTIACPWQIHTPELRAWKIWKCLSVHHNRPALEHLSGTCQLHLWYGDRKWDSALTEPLRSPPPRFISLSLSLHVAPWVALIELWETSPLTVETPPLWHFLPPSCAMQQSQHPLPPRFLLMSLSMALDQHLPLVNKAFPMGDRATQVTLTPELKSSNDSIWSREEQ